jgi:hypothetical protein
MKKNELKRLSIVLASLMGDTERNELYTISGGIIGFKSMNAADVIYKYISLLPEEMINYKESLADVEPVYYSLTDNCSHTAIDFLEKEDAIEAMSISNQESQKDKNWFMPLFEVIARQTNTSSKAHRIANIMELYYDKAINKQVTLGLLKLSVNLLNKFSDQMQNNVDKIRDKCMFLHNMHLYFEREKISILRSEKRHLVPNLDDFFKMKRHLQVKYSNPIKWYFQVHAEQLKGVEFTQYQLMKQHKENQLASNALNDIARLIHRSYDVINPDNKPAF